MIINGTLSLNPSFIKGFLRGKWFWVEPQSLRKKHLEHLFLCGSVGNVKVKGGEGVAGIEKSVSLRCFVTLERLGAAVQAKMNDSTFITLANVAPLFMLFLNQLAYQ